MKVIDVLVESDKTTRDNVSFINESYEDSGFRLFNALEFENSISLSIQASFGHYCLPRKTLKVNEYSNMELAVFKNNGFTNVDNVINNKELITKLNEHYDGSIYAYVPIELLDELYMELVNN